MREEMSKENKEKLVPKYRFPEFKDAGEWEEKRLEKIAERITEKVGERKFKLMSITSGIGLVSQLDKFGKEIAGKSYKNYYVIHNNDFAYNKSSTKLYPEGEIAMYEYEDIGAVPNSIFICFRFDKNIINPFFAKYPFERNIHGYWLNRFITVGARAHGALQISNEDLFSLPFTFPSLAEQNRIANCLSSADDTITAQTEKVESLELHKKALMQKLFPKDGENIPEYRFPEFKDAQEWEEKEVGQIFELQDGYNFSPSDFTDEYNNNTQIVRITEINNRNTNKEKVYITNDKAEELKIKKYEISRGDLLLSLTGAAGFNFFIWNKEKGYINQRTLKLNPKNDENKYSSVILETLIHKKINSIGTGQNNNLSKRILESIKFLLPSQKEQKRIADCLSSIDDRVEAEKEKLDLLKLHKKALMQGLFPNNSIIKL